jgi:hypothetical protein
MLHHSRSVSSRWHKRKERISTTVLQSKQKVEYPAQQNRQLPIISRRRINGKEYVTPVESETIEVSNETEVGIYTVSACRNYLVTTKIRLE